MKWLEPRFSAELSNEENFWISDRQVFIRNRSFSAAEIVDYVGVKEDSGKNILFDELFKEWHREYKERQIEQADEILQQFKQVDRFRRLCEFHRTKSVMPFVGAGLSMPSGYPGWTHFLRTQRVQTAITETELEDWLKNGQYEHAAQQIANAQGIAFNEAMDSAFGCSLELSGPIEMLPYVFSGSVVTTNFDNCLERAYINAGLAISEKLTGADSAEIRRMLLQEGRLLLMLHGKATSGRGRILTQDEYDLHYTDGNTLAKTIGALCANQHLLFLGCSLTVDRTITAIQSFVTSEGHDNVPKHYAFLADPEDETKRLARQKDLADCHIYPIWYPADTHNESIEALLVKLHEASQ